jgi:aryl-alcohol dehydrogenase-like predicted oxidoreductase
VPLSGTRTPERLDENIAALSVTLRKKGLDEIEASG